MKLFFALLFLSGLVHSATIVEDFTTITKKDSSTAVWNFTLGKIHPTLLVNNYEEVAATPQSLNFDVGDGTHGSFEVARYGLFGTVVGTVITIDASVFPVLKFTRFELAPGYTLSSINGPLVIYSLSDVIIEGLIQCRGFDGLSSNSATGANGGIGRCGGQAGGTGGNSASSGLAGIPNAGVVSGGLGGNYIAAAAGSGGGGAGTLAGVDGFNGSNSNPATNTFGAGGSGVAGEDLDFTSLAGSPGGGGGSGSNTAGGGGGGGGGGTVIIRAVNDVTLTLTGFIEASGGDGGLSTSNGGGGGGGGGGSVQIFAGADITLVPAGTVIDVSGGLGGDTANVNAGDGGDGANGRTWLVQSTPIIGGAGTESHPSLLFSFGLTEYTIAPQVILTKSYDTNSDLTKLNSVNASPSNTGVTIEVAGSADDFVSDDSGWIPVAQISGLNKRYFKFKITLTNTSATAPVTIDSLIVDYDSGIVQEFNFKGCGLITSAQQPKNPPYFTLVVAILFFIPVGLAQRLKAIKSKQKI